MTGQTDIAATDELVKESSVADARTTVTTQMTFAASPSAAWRALVFYEQIDSRPPFLLSLLLPVPVGTKGDSSEVGGESLCLCEGGHLVKRAKRIDAPTLYEFEVTEQALRVGGTMRLCGGSYRLREVSRGTEVTIETRYISRKRPRWLWRPMESLVCHMFHRFLLRAMRRRAENS